MRPKRPFEMVDVVGPSFSTEKLPDDLIRECSFVEETP